MRDRHVRRIVLGLILAFPVLIAWMSPAPAGRVRAPQRAETLGSLALVEGILIAGLFGAYRARRGLLAGRALLADDTRASLTDAHFSQTQVPAAFEAAAR